MAVLSINDVYQPVRMDLSYLNQPRKSGLDSLGEVISASRQRKADERKMKLLEQEAADRRKMNDLLFQEKEMNLNKAREAQIDDKMIGAAKKGINEMYGPLSSALSVAAGGVPIPTTVPRGVAEKAGVDMLRGQGREEEARKIEDYALSPGQSFAKLGLYDQANKAVNENPVALGAMGGGKVDFTPSDQEDIVMRPDGSQFKKVTSGNGKVSLERIKGPDPLRELKGDSYGGLDAVTWEEGKAPVSTRIRNPIMPHGSGGSGGGRSSRSGNSKVAGQMLQGLNFATRQRAALEKEIASFNDPMKTYGLSEEAKAAAVSSRQKKISDLQKAENYYKTRYFEATGFDSGLDSGDDLGFNSMFGPDSETGSNPGGSSGPGPAPLGSGRSMLEKMRADKAARAGKAGGSGNAPAKRPGIEETYNPPAPVVPVAAPPRVVNQEVFGPPRPMSDPLAVDYGNQRPGAKSREEKSLLDFYAEDALAKFNALRDITGSDPETLARLEEERRNRGSFAP